MPKIPMNVRMEVEVDLEAWDAEYGTPVADVETYLLNQVALSPAAEAGAIRVVGLVVDY